MASVTTIVFGKTKLVDAADQAACPSAGALSFLKLVTRLGETGCAIACCEHDDGSPAEDAANFSGNGLDELTASIEARIRWSCSGEDAMMMNERGEDSRNGNLAKEKSQLSSGWSRSDRTSTTSSPAL